MRLRLPPRAVAPKTVLATSPDPKEACMSPDASEAFEPAQFLRRAGASAPWIASQLELKHGQQSRYGTIFDQLQPSAHPWTHAHEEIELKTASLP